jgi:hypothetical protein
MMKSCHELASARLDVLNREQAEAGAFARLTFDQQGAARIARHLGYLASPRPRLLNWWDSHCRLNRQPDIRIVPASGRFAGLVVDLSPVGRALSSQATEELRTMLAERIVTPGVTPAFRRRWSGLAVNATSATAWPLSNDPNAIAEVVNEVRRLIAVDLTPPTLHVVPAEV